uniref:Uncharacterized protein n=1 Tax=Rhizophora mucronata TaxID=61149 RepID=A0A2P2R541_RHIMU
MIAIQSNPMFTRKQTLTSYS